MSWLHEQAEVFYSFRPGSHPHSRWSVDAAKIPTEVRRHQYSTENLGWKTGLKTTLLDYIPGIPESLIQKRYNSKNDFYQ